jgi:hypothetical protein
VLPKVEVSVCICLPRIAHSCRELRLLLSSPNRTVAVRQIAVQLASRALAVFWIREESRSGDIGRDIRPWMGGDGWCSADKDIQTKTCSSPQGPTYFGTRAAGVAEAIERAPAETACKRAFLQLVDCGVRQALGM